MRRPFPALALASTIRHDGEGGVADDLTTVAEAGRFARTCSGEGEGPAADEELLRELIALRRAVRALFARAVSPAPPSRADAYRLMPVAEAVAHVNATAARAPVALQLDWPEDGAPSLRLLPSPGGGPHAALLAALARSAIDFLGGPDRPHLRACPAPRCVKYFVQTHGRQEWCTPTCGNRARVARHYRRHRDTGG